MTEKVTADSLRGSRVSADTNDKIVISLIPATLRDWDLIFFLLLGQHQTQQKQHRSP
jgi:hypothetical protein